MLRRPPRAPLPPSAHDVLREALLLRSVEDADVRTPRVLPTCDDESVIGAPFYVMEKVRATSYHLAARGAGLRGRAPPVGRGADRRAGGDPRRRLARLRAGGLRQADGLPRPPAAALRRPVGAQQDARAADAGPRHRVAGRAPARVRRRDHRPRRLPPRQRDVRPRRAGAAGRHLRLGAGHHRRPAGRPRLPARHLRRRPATRRTRSSRSARSPASPASRAATS